MLEKHLPPFPSLSSRKEAAASTAAHRESYDAELAEKWLRERAVIGHEGKQHEIDIFHAMATITSLKSRNSSRRYDTPRELPPQLLTARNITDELQTASVYFLLDENVGGISLSELFDQGIKLAQEKPCEVYSHMLLRTQPFGQANSDIVADCNFLPVTAYSTGEIEDIIKSACYPRHVSTALKEFSAMYLTALTQVKKDFFDPTSERFADIAELYRRVASRGSDLQLDIFHAQILGIGIPSLESYTYSSLRDLMDQEEYPEIYDACIAALEKSYGGFLGEDAYEPLGITEDPDCEPSWQAFQELHAKKYKVLKLAKQDKGEIRCVSTHYGALEVENTTVEFHKHGDQSHVTVSFTVRSEEGETIPVTLQLDPAYRYSWGFLRTPDEVPELFNLLAVSAHQILDEALSQLSPPVVATDQPNAFKPKEHTRDIDVIEERKKHKEELRAPLVPAPLINAETSPIEPKPTREVHFPESLNGQYRKDAELAVDKFKNNLINPKALTELSPRVSDKLHYSLRQGSVRVILTFEEGEWKVVDYGDRKDIYKRFARSKNNSHA